MWHSKKQHLTLFHKWTANVPKTEPQILLFKSACSHWCHWLHCSSTITIDNAGGCTAQWHFSSSCGHRESNIKLSNQCTPFSVRLSILLVRDTWMSFKEYNLSLKSQKEDLKAETSVIKLFFPSSTKAKNLAWGSGWYLWYFWAHCPPFFYI